jgi:ATP/maltotriose-dependent transcriptional regulator MalT
MTEIQEAYLWFEVEETVALVGHVTRIKLPKEEIATPAVRTEGWIAALQLAALLLPAGG